MAALVTPLAAGIAAAPSGTAEFFLEGTSTPATVYSDAHGTVIAAAPHTLDAEGSIVRYVKARINVVVKTAGGANVMSFVVGGDARDVRVENLGFTGPDAGGSIVPGGRTTLDEVLTDLYASLGALDGKVDAGGGAQDISDAIGGGGGGSGIFFVVNATADGVTDASNGIEDAILDADAASGGVVVFPPGTYVLTRILATASNITFLGLGNATIKATFNSTSGYFSHAASTTVTFRNLTFTTTSTASGNICLRASNASSRINAYDCVFPAAATSSTGMTSITLANASAEAFFSNCRFTIDLNGAATRVGSATSSGSRLTLIGCTINDTHTGLTRTAFDGSVSSMIELIGCKYTAIGGSGNAVVLGSGAYSARITGGHYLFSSASVNFIVFAGTGYAAVSGAMFEQTGTSTLYLNGTTGGTLAEAGCTFLSTSGTIDMGTGTTRSQYRNSRIGTTVTGAWTTSINLTTSNHLLYANYTSGAPGTYTVSTPSPIGGECGIGDYTTFILRNGTGGAVTVSWNAIWLVPTGYTSIAAGATWRMMFQRTATSEYTCVSSQQT